MSGGMIAVVAALFFGSSIIGMVIGRKMFSVLGKISSKEVEK